MTISKFNLIMWASSSMGHYGLHFGLEFGTMLLEKRLIVVHHHIGPHSRKMKIVWLGEWTNKHKRYKAS
jgi:hypothetical protein